MSDSDEGSISSSSDDDNVKPLTLRDFPVDLYWRSKEVAARKRMSHKNYIIEAVKEAVRRDSKRARPG